jgi:sterol desaturase/sphingolipid hydroxylase (fatty acid hydroxylase superfamily)
LFPLNSAATAMAPRSASPSPARTAKAAAGKPAASSKPAPAPAPAAAAAAAATWGLPRGLSWWEFLLLVAALALFCAGLDLRFAASLREALRPFDTATVRLASFSDAQLQAGIMLAVYVVQYCALGGLFEGTHPDGALSSSLPPQRLAQRRRQVRSEFATGVFSLAVTVACAVGWMWLVEPRLWTYGWFAAREQGGQGHELTPALAVGAVLAYVAAFDTHFFWSHWLLHESTTLWNNVHYYHHSYKEPSAFAQFSVHPLESVLQGPFGHFFVQLFFPVHPVQLALMGFLSSAWAFAAHDGRGLDINNHFFHHSKGRGRKYYFVSRFFLS